MEAAGDEGLHAGADAGGPLGDVRKQHGRGGVLRQRELERRPPGEHFVRQAADLCMWSLSTMVWCMVCTCSAPSAMEQAMCLPGCGVWSFDMHAEAAGGRGDFRCWWVTHTGPGLTRL